MKKLSLFFLLSLITVTLTAQDAACSVGVQLGFNQNIYRVNSPTTNANQQQTLNKTNLNGFKVGAVFEGNIIRGFGALISLNYAYGGGTTQWRKISEVSIYPQTRSRYDLHLLEIACDWQYKFKIAKDTYFLLYTGPAIQCNLSFHEQKFTQVAQGVPGDDPVIKDQLIRSVENADDWKAYSRWNVTWGVGAGFQYDRYFIRGGYDFGLVNPLSYDNFNQVHNPAGRPMYADQLTRGRADQWFIKLGIFLWQSDN